MAETSETDNLMLGEEAVNRRVDDDNLRRAKERMSRLLEQEDESEEEAIMEEDGMANFPKPDSSEGGFVMRPVPYRGREVEDIDDESIDGRIQLKSKAKMFGGYPTHTGLPGMQALGAGLDGVSNLLNSIQDAYNYVAGEDDPGEGESRLGDIIPEIKKESFFENELLQAGNNLSRPMVEFLVNFYGVKKFTKAAGFFKNSKKTKAAMDGILAEFTAYDANYEGLSNLIESYPELANPITSFMKTRREDPNVVNRIKRAVIDGPLKGIVTDRILDGFVGALRIYRDRQRISTMKKRRAESGIMDEPLIIRSSEFPDEGLAGKRRRQLRVEGQSETARALQPETPLEAKGKVKDIPRKTPRFRINYDRMDTGQDIKNMIAQLRRMKDKDLAAGLEDAEAAFFVKEAKETILDDPDKAVAEVLGIKDPAAASRKQQQMARILDLTSAAYLADTRNKVLAGEVPQDEMLRSILMFYKLHQASAAIGAGSSRKMSDRKEIVSPLQESLQSFTEEVDTMLSDEGFDLDNIDGMAAAEMLGILEEPSKRAAMLKKLKGPTMLKMMTELWMSGLLSGVPTHLTNFGMTSLNILNEFLPEKFFTAMWDTAFRTPEEDKTYFRQLGMGFYKYNESVRHAWKLARSAWDVTAVGGTSKELDEIGGPNAIKLEGFGEPQATVANLNKAFRRGQQALGKEGDEFFEFNEQGWMAMILDGTFNLFRKVGARPVITSDTFLKALAFRMSLTDQAAQQAISKGLQGADFYKFIDESVSNPPEHLRIKAQSLAEELTFTNEPGRIGQAFQGMVEKLPLLRIPFPFVRTPSNLNRVAFEKFPGLNFLIKESRESIFGQGPEKGKQARRSRALAKLSMGAAIGFAAYQAANSGNATGSGPVGPNAKDARATLKAAGWQEDSLVWQADNGTLHYYSFDRADPFGQIMGLVVDLKKFRNRVDPEVVNNAETALLLAISKQMLSKTWATNARKIFDAMLAPDRTDARSLKQLTGTVIPRLVANMGKVVDPTFRETRTIFDEIMKGVPGLSKGLHAKRDWLGSDIVDEGALWNTLMPSRHSKSTGREFDNLRREAFSVGARFPVPDGFISDEQGVSINITGLQENWLVRHVARGVKDPDGKTFIEKMNEEISSKDYQVSDDGITPRSNFERAEIWRENYVGFLEQAKEDFKEKYPEVASRLRRMLQLKLTEETGKPVELPR